MDDRIDEVSYWNEKPISPINEKYAELGAAIKEVYKVAMEALELAEEILRGQPLSRFDVEAKGEGNYLTLRPSVPMAAFAGSDEPIAFGQAQVTDEEN